jgi:homoserine kinase
MERRRHRLIPGYATVCERAHRAGAAGVTLSGAGPSIAAVVDRGKNLFAVALAMREGFRSASVDSDVFIAGAAGGATIVEAR